MLQHVLREMTHLCPAYCVKKEYFYSLSLFLFLIKEKVSPVTFMQVKYLIFFNTLFILYYKSIQKSFFFIKII